MPMIRAFLLPCGGGGGGVEGATIIVGCWAIWSRGVLIAVISSAPLPNILDIPEVQFKNPVPLVLVLAGVVVVLVGVIFSGFVGILIPMGVKGFNSSR